MRQVVESLARLYRADKITIKKIEQLLKEKKISKEEYDFILSK